MRELLNAAEGKPDSRAALALDMFCYRVRKYIGAYLAVLGEPMRSSGGGIGERSAIIRARICDGMDWCGLRLDSLRNEAAMAIAPGDAMKISEEAHRWPAMWRASMKGPDRSRHARLYTEQVVQQSVKRESLNAKRPWKT